MSFIDAWPHFWDSDRDFGTKYEQIKRHKHDMCMNIYGNYADVYICTQNAIIIS